MKKYAAERVLPGGILQPHPIVDEIVNVEVRVTDDPLDDVHGTWKTGYLQERPYAGTLAVTHNGVPLTLVPGNPSGATEYSCDWKRGIIFVDPAVAWNGLVVSYSGLGAVVDWQRIEMEYETFDKPPVLSEIDLTAGPGAGISKGDRYINTVTGVSFLETPPGGSGIHVPVTATYIYEWDGTGWYETPSSEGMLVYNLAPSIAKYRIFKGGSWVDFVAGVEEAPADHKKYGRKDKAWVEIVEGGGSAQKRIFDGYYENVLANNEWLKSGIVPESNSQSFGPYENATPYYYERALCAVSGSGRVFATVGFARRSDSNTYYKCVEVFGNYGKDTKTTTLDTTFSTSLTGRDLTDVQLSYEGNRGYFIEQILSNSYLYRIGDGTNFPDGGVGFNYSLASQATDVRCTHDGKVLVLVNKNTDAGLVISTDYGLTRTPMTGLPSGTMHRGWWGLNNDGTTIVDCHGTSFYKSTNMSAFVETSLSAILPAGYSLISGLIAVSPNGQHIVCAATKFSEVVVALVSHDGGVSWVVKATQYVHGYETYNMSRIFVSADGSKIVVVLSTQTYTSYVGYLEENYTGLGGFMFKGLDLGATQQFVDGHRYAQMSADGNLLWLVLRSQYAFTDSQFRVFYDSFRKYVEYDARTSHGGTPFFDGAYSKLATSVDGFVCVNTGLRYNSGYPRPNAISRRRRIVPNVGLNDPVDGRYYCRKDGVWVEVPAPAAPVYACFKRKTTITYPNTGGALFAIDAGKTVSSVRVVVKTPTDGGAGADIVVGDADTADRFVESGDVDIADADSLFDFPVHTEYGTSKNLTAAINWGAGASQGNVDIVIEYE